MLIYSPHISTFTPSHSQAWLTDLVSPSKQPTASNSLMKPFALLTMISPPKNADSAQE